MNKNFFKEFSDFTNQLFSNNKFLSKFGNVEDLFTDEEKGTKDNKFSYKKTRYEKYEDGHLVKKNEVVYKNGEMVKNEKYEAPTNTLENTKEKPKFCQGENTENNGVCKCGNKDGRCGQDENVVNDDVIRGYEEIVRRGALQICEENTSLKDENTKLLLQISELKEDVVKYQNELENINGFISLYQETLKEQNDKIQELVDKLTQYKEIEKLIDKLRK
jgi:hypothetical protein